MSDYVMLEALSKAARADIAASAAALNHADRLRPHIKQRGVTSAEARNLFLLGVDCALDGVVRQVFRDRVNELGGVGMGTLPLELCMLALAIEEASK